MGRGVKVVKIENLQYTGLDMSRQGMILVYNKLTRDILIKAGCCPQANYMENQVLGLDFCKAVEGYIIQHLGGRKQKITNIVALSEVAISSIGQGRRIIVYKKNWNKVCEIYTYPTVNPIEAFVFECLVAAAVERYIKSMKKRLKENGWDAAA